jgi:FKBP-type peptidyl-prolyl cis-trans isomerase 2
VAVHYYARLVAKQGWRFDSSYDNLDRFGEAIPFSFTVGDEGVIEGLNLMVLNMREGSVVRVVIPGDKGYQNRQQQPIPREFSDRQRLYTTIFNPTRIANGEGETLGALIFDLELLSVRPK